MNVISFCVWGNGSAYYYGVLDNAIFISEKLPTFQTWIYHNNTIPPIIKQYLQKLERIKLIEMPNTHSNKNRLWRFIPAFDKNVNIFLSRDADSRITEKEITAVTEWLKSDKDFHIMRDSTWHVRKILAGMWGCRNQILIPYTNHFLNYMTNNEDINYTISDELYLQKYIYPFIFHKSFIHSSYTKYEPHAKDFSFRNKIIEVGKVDFSTNNIKKKFPELIIPTLKKS